MLDKLPIIGAEIRRKMDWIPRNQPIYLVMDNAGGHGTETAINEYTHRLSEENNVRIIHQAARSPETNALDLGVWMSVQSHVERAHRNKARDPDILANTVQESWTNLPVDTIKRIFDRIPVNLQLIIEHEGSNEFVETRRGRRQQQAQIEQQE